VTAGAVVPIAVAIRRPEVIRFLGCPEDHVLPPALAALLDEALAEARRLVQARGAFVEVAPERAAEVGLTPVRARGLALGLVTAGAAIEERAAAVGRSGEAARALVLDAAGSAAVEEAADRLGALIAGGAAAPDDPGTLPCRVSPGYPGWALTDQPRLFRLLPHAALGVTLLPSAMMVPEKSISFAMWLGRTGRAPGAGGCSRCGLARCRFRRPARQSAGRSRNGGSSQ
jgi:hypothetical protein